MKQLKTAILALGVVCCFSAAPVQAAGIWGACSEDSTSEVCKDKTKATDIVKRIINLFLFSIGALAVIMIIHSGLKYTTSRGDAEGVKSAKNTLLYAVIGLIVASMAFAIVNFVVGAFQPATPPASPQQGQTGVQ